MSISLILTFLSESYIYEGDLKKGWTWKLDNDNFNPGQKSQVWLRNILIQLRLSQILYNDCTLTVFPWKISICHPVHIEIGVANSLRSLSGLCMGQRRSNQVSRLNSTINYSVKHSHAITAETSYDSYGMNDWKMHVTVSQCRDHVWVVNFNDLNMSTRLASFQ